MPKHEKSQHQKIGDKTNGKKITQSKLYQERIWMLVEKKFNHIYLNYITKNQVVKKSAVFCVQALLVDCFLSFYASNSN